MHERLRTRPVNLRKRSHQKFISNITKQDTITYVNNREQ